MTTTERRLPPATRTNATSSPYDDRDRTRTISTDPQLLSAPKIGYKGRGPVATGPGALAPVGSKTKVGLMMDLVLRHAVDKKIQEARSNALLHAEPGDTVADTGLWDEAGRFLLRCIGGSVFGAISTLPLPDVSDAHNGTIDVAWQAHGRRVVLSIARTPELRVSHYGQDIASGVDVIEGDRSIAADHSWILSWLMN